MGVETLCNLALYAVKSTTADKENIAGIDMNIILVGMLASSLGGDVPNSSLKKLQH